MKIRLHVGKTLLLLLPARKRRLIRECVFVNISFKIKTLATPKILLPILWTIYQWQKTLICTRIRSMITVLVTIWIRACFVYSTPPDVPDVSGSKSFLLVLLIRVPCDMYYQFIGASMWCVLSVTNKETDRQIKSLTIISLTKRNLYINFKIL